MSARHVCLWWWETHGSVSRVVSEGAAGMSWRPHISLGVAPQWQQQQQAWQQYHVFCTLRRWRQKISSRGVGENEATLWGVSSSGHSVTKIANPFCEHTKISKECFSLFLWKLETSPAMGWDFGSKVFLKVEASGKARSIFPPMTVRQKWPSGAGRAMGKLASNILLNDLFVIRSSNNNHND
jgi:hypothetical protein